MLTYGTRGDVEPYVAVARVLAQASNAQRGDRFGGFASTSSSSVTLSADGETLAVGAFGESSLATGIGGDQSNNDAPAAGAVYLF